MRRFLGEESLEFEWTEGRRPPRPSALGDQ